MLILAEEFCKALEKENSDFDTAVQILYFVFSISPLAIFIKRTV